MLSVCMCVATWRFEHTDRLFMQLEDLKLTSSLFRDLTRRRLTVDYEHFRETCRAHLQGSGKVQYVELEIDAIGRKPWLVSQAPCIYFLIMLCHVTQYLKYNCNKQAWYVKYDSKVSSLCFAFRLNVWLAGWLAGYLADCHYPAQWQSTSICGHHCGTLIAVPRATFSFLKWHVSKYGNPDIGLAV